jgi:hypothetical protein
MFFQNLVSMGEIWNQPTIVSVSYLNPIHSKSVLWLLTKCLVINWDPTWSNTTGCCCHSHYWFCLGLNRRFWDPSHCTVLCRVCSNHHPAVLHENRVKTVLTCGALHLFLATELQELGRTTVIGNKTCASRNRFAAFSGQDPQEAAKTDQSLEFDRTESSRWKRLHKVHYEIKHK